MSSFIDEDFRLVNKVYLKLDDELNRNQELSTEKMIVWLVWTALGIVGNGGFYYFYENRLDATAVSKALKDLGLAAAAKTFKNAEELSDRCVNRNQWEIFADFLDRHAKEYNDQFLLFMGFEEAIKAALAGFVKQNKLAG